MAKNAAGVLLLGMAVLLACAPDVAVAQPKGEHKWLELEVRGWAPTFKGTMTSGANGNAGTDLNFESQLGIDTQQSFYWPRLLPRFADRHRLAVSYLKMQYAGDSVLNESITFGGSTYSIGEGIRAEFEITQAGLAYEYDFLKYDRVASFIGLRVDVLRIEAEVRGDTIGVRREGATVPVPTPGAGLRVWPFDWLKIGGRIHGIKGGVAGYEGELIDAEAFATVSPWDWLGFGVGYRYYKGKGRDEDSGDRLNWLQKGPFLSLIVRPF